MILIIISALISSVVMILLMPINIKKLNKIAIDKELNKISEKYPDNIEICKEILKKMENEKTQIEENAESDSTLYIALQDKIYLGNMHGSFTRIQTIAHECLHSIQDRKVLIFNFIFSNIYILYFIISSILIIIKKLPNELVFSNILLIISMLYYAIRMFLENDAMTKSEYLAKEYLKEKKIVDEEEVKNFIAESKKQLGSIDILINNAGITKDGLLMRMKEKDFSDVLDVNLKGTFITTREAASIMMKQRHGKIINISSVVGVIGNAGQCNYAASKAGVIGFSKSVARELASRNITVNVVAPGFINTDMTGVLPEKVKESMLQGIPLKRIGEPKDIANAVLFLASDLSNYITGQVINVDGGMVMN